MTADARVWFVGVSTGESMIHRLLPAWADVLGVRAQVRGYDLALASPATAYLEMLEELAADERALGAVVTSHKIALLAAARGRFRQLEPIAELLGEANAIRHTAQGFEGFARDVRAIRRTLDETFGTTASAGDEVLCLGLGGASRALLLATMVDSEIGSPPYRLRPGAPRVFHAVGRNRERLAEFGEIARRAGVPADRIRLHHAQGGAEAGDLVASMPAGSLIVNATGLGKDAPGSPVSASTQFPSGSTAWDFNYRGDLRFLDTAAAGYEDGVRLMDGWLYFLHGWTEALAPLLGTTLDDPTFARLAHVSASFQSEASRGRAALGPSAPTDGAVHG